MTIDDLVIGKFYTLDSSTTIVFKIVDKGVDWVLTLRHADHEVKPEILGDIEVPLLIEVDSKICEHLFTDLVYKDYRSLI